MKFPTKFITFWLFSLLVLDFSRAASMTVGGNLTVGESGEQQVFLDVFRQSRHWQTRNADGSGAYNTELYDQIPLDAEGWPLRVPFTVTNGLPAQRAHTVIGARGQGAYKLTMVGKGRISFAADEGLIDTSSPFFRSVEFQANGGTNTFDLTLHTDATQLIFVDILESDAADPLRRIQLFMPGHTNESGPSGAFLPAYLESVQNFSVLRFMDMGQINGNPLALWSERTLPVNYSQIDGRGMAFEWMIELANRVQRPAWICVPHRADDDFVRQMARLIRDTLDTDLKAYIEYSNETWNFNPGFSQSIYVMETGAALGLTAEEYHARRSAEIWTIFEEEFGAVPSADRLVKVFASQAGRAGLTVARLEALKDSQVNPTGIRADTLAIAPYFGGAVGDAIGDAGTSGTVTVEEILDLAAVSMRGEVAQWTQEHAALAEANGLWLIDYEAGQHLVGNGANQNDDVLTDKLIAANRHPRMGELYYEYLDNQQRDGVVLTALFAHVATPSVFGSWGMLEHPDQTVEDAPKWLAFTEWITDTPPTNLPPRADAGGDQSVAAAAGQEHKIVFLDASASRDLDGVIVSYAWRMSGEIVSTNRVAEIDLTLGLHVVELTVTDSSDATAVEEATITITPAAANEVLFTSNFLGADPALNLPWTNTVALGEGVTYSGLSAGAGINLRPGNNELAFWISGTGDGNVQTLAASLAANEFFTFTVTPDEGRALDLRGANFVVQWRRYTDHGPRRLALFSSLDGFTEAQVIAISEENASIDESSDSILQLPFEGYNGITEPVVFRLVPFGEKFHNHEVGFESITLTGAALAPAAPALSIVLVDGQIELRWPEGPHQLVGVGTLQAPLEWAPVGAEPTLEDGLNVVRLPLNGTQRYFGLQRLTE